MDNALSALIAATVAFLIAILSGLGVGSGGLFVIWLVSVYRVSAPQARGMNLLFFVFSASAALILHWFKKRVDLSLIFKLSLFALIGTLLGTFVSRYVSAMLLRQIFGGFLILAGLYSLLSGKLLKKGRSKEEF